MTISSLNFENDLHILAEIGVNHEGDIGRAKKLIELAKNSGCSSVKLQAYKAETLVTKKARAYWDKSKENTESQLELFKKYDAFNLEDYVLLSEHAHSVGLQFGLSIFDITWIKPLSQIVDYFKVASGDITCFPLLSELSTFSKPIILSTGASSLEEIIRSYNVLTSQGNQDVHLLHCILSYPAKLEDSNLSFIRTLSQKFPKSRIGISDHVPNEEYERFIIARTLGVSIVEKHFTDDTTLPGNDHYHSGNSEFFFNLKEKIQYTDQLLGSGEEFLESELPARTGARRSIVYKADMISGQKVGAHSFLYKRPGEGLSPFEVPNLIGKVLKKDVLADDLVSLSDFEISS